MTELHIEAQQFLADLASDPPPAWYEMTLDEARAAFEKFAIWGGESPEVHRCDDITLPSGLMVRMYRPNPDESVQVRPPPVVLYAHGGGWVLGSVDSHDALCRRLAIESDAVVVSVDYRRAPEHPFPAALDDCWETLQWIASEATSLGVDVKRLIAAGDSAGGNLALALALRSRESSGPKFSGQILLYPVVSRSFETDSYRRYAEGFGLTRKTMEFFWHSYLSEAAAAVSPSADLMQVADLAGLPPTHMVLATHDVLFDEGAKLADRLKQAGVPTTVKTYPGMLHGFVHLAGLFADGAKATSDVANVVRSFVD